MSTRTTAHYTLCTLVAATVPRISALCGTLAFGLLAACSGNNLGSTGFSVPSAGSQSQVSHRARMPLSLVPSWMTPAGESRLDMSPGERVLPATAKSTSTIWASQFNTGTCGTSCYDEGFVNGYPNPNKSNGKAFCGISVYYVNGIGADPSAYLMIPGYFSGSAYTVNVYDPATSSNQSGDTCPAELGSMTDTTGQPADAASTNAATGKLVVGEIANFSTGVGDIVICTIASGACGTPITNSSITSYVAGVAVDSKGNCWATAETKSFASSIMVYWAGCTGSGVVATGYKNAYYGGLFFDTKGNLVSVDLSGKLYVYKGCNPACTMVSSTTLEGESLFGNLNSTGDELFLGDVTNGRCDVYKYAPSGSKYSYSFNNGLTPSDDVESCLSATESSSSTKATVIVDFGGGADGDTPNTTLISDSSGNLYGTTQAGGTSADGIVFELTPSGTKYTETVLHSFTGSGGDGAVPQGALLLGSGGVLYGTTSQGGDATCKCGVIFSLTPGSGGSYTYSTLYKFLGGADGATPMAGLVVGADGKMYGTTEYGGNTSCAANGCGTMFQYTSSHGYLQDATFDSSTGTFPVAPLTPFGCISSCTSGHEVELAGAASQGGAVTSCTGGCGTIFTAVKHSSGWSVSAVYSFGSHSGDGTDPQSPLTEVSDYPPALAGVTASGGSSCGCGTVYYAQQPTSGTWHETVLHQFSNSSGDGGYPVGGLVVDSTGALFGATSAGGTNGAGTAFELTYSGSGSTPSEGVIYNYDPKTGTVPLAGFLLGSSGHGKETFYGTASSGGKSEGRRPGGGGTAMIIVHEGGAGVGVKRGAPAR